MAIASAGPFTIPAPSIEGATPSFNLSTLNASGDKCGWVFRAPQTGNIRKLSFATGTVTTATDTDLRLETVSAQVPSGTLQGTNTNVTVVAASITSNAWVTGQLTADASVTRGDLLAIAIVPTGSPNYAVRKHVGGQGNQLPYVVEGDTGTYVPSSGTPAFGVEYDDGLYYPIPGVWPAKALNTHTFNSGSTPDELALKFRLPVPVRVSGGWVIIDLDNSVDFVLYDSDGSTVLATASATSAGRLSTSGRSAFYFEFAAQTLTANTFYRLAVKPGASNITVYSFDVDTNAVLGMVPGGVDFSHSTRTDAGAWSDVTTRHLWMGLLINGVDAGGSSGGGGPVVGNSIVRAA